VDIAHDAENARAWLRARGFDVRVEKRSLREDFVRRGLRGVDTIDLAYWADLVGIANPAFIVPNYGSGMIPEQAVIRARQRYGQEQT